MTHVTTTAPRAATARYSRAGALACLCYAVAGYLLMLAVLGNAIGFFAAAGAARVPALIPRQPFRDPRQD